jgi:ADP-ribose pyrophosphatase YjhB (NUDIX family)
MQNNHLETNIISKKLNAPLYLYQMPMFMLTVSTVVIVENGVVLIKKEHGFEFPMTIVQAGKETVQFAAIRSIKENLGITVSKNILIPVDFRSNPERSKEGNVVDIGMFCMLESLKVEDCKGIWTEVDFEQNKIIDKSINLLNDHVVLLNRTIDIVSMVRN